MFKRALEHVLLEYTQFPVIAILGPRQSGKTTLARKVFDRYRYVSFEDPAVRQEVERDPRRFLQLYDNEHGVIIDEFQHVPQILSYLQLEVDEKKRKGYFILTGSQNFLMNQAITQSLAGRVGILNLFPLSLQELQANNILPSTIDQMLLNGCYPRIYEEHVAPQKLYPSYTQTYIERDVRQLVNVGNLRAFQLFIQLCAGRIGQLLNLSEIAGVCGISVSTAQQWLSIAEASYILFLLKPHHNNFNKRLTKSPKIYFFDTGVACSLLGIDSLQELAFHPLRGSLFESFIIADFYKQFCTMGKRPALYFWRDQNGRLEVDCILETALSLTPIEIKSGQTVASDFFKGINQWCSLAGIDSEKGIIVYGGDLNQQRSNGAVMGWSAVADLVEKIKKV